MSNLTQDASIYNRFMRVFNREVEGDIVCGDCLDVMRQMPDGCVDAVITDPPFEDLNVVMPRLEEAFRLINDGGVAYVLLDWHLVHDAAVQLRKLKPLVGEIIWRVGWVSGFRSHQQSRWVVNHNTILQFGNPRYFVLPRREPRTKLRARYGTETRPVAFDTVWDDLPSVRQTSFVKVKTGHPFEKPVALMERLIASSVPTGGIVFDPFMGSGTTAVAAKKLGRHWFGCDINPEYVKLANERVVVVQPTLF